MFIVVQVLGSNLSVNRLPSLDLFVLSTIKSPTEHAFIQCDMTNKP